MSAEFKNYIFKKGIKHNNVKDTRAKWSVRKNEPTM